MSSNFKCFICYGTFCSSKDAIKHLKKVHSVVENQNPIKCLVNHSDVCSYVYFTFPGLRKHMKQCEQNLILNEVNK